MDFRKTDGFLLRWRDLGLGDRWMTWFTRETGLTKVIVARRKVAAEPGLRSPLTLDRATLVLLDRRMQPGHRLVDYALCRRHLWLAGDLERFGGGMLVVDAMERLSAEDDPQPAAFDLLDRFLRELRCAADPATVTAWGMVKLFTLLGYGLGFGECRACGRPPSGKGLFVAHKGGFLHARCAGKSAGLTVSPGTLTFLCRLGAAAPSEARRLRADALVARETAAVLGSHLLALCQSRTGTQRFLAKTAAKRAAAVPRRTGQGGGRHGA